mgnify:CR=1 FL=1
MLFGLIVFGAIVLVVFLLATTYNGLITASERAGSGIGLALTKRLVEVHGGHIEVISPVSDGRGARFRFRWPRFPRRTSDE